MCKYLISRWISVGSFLIFSGCLAAQHLPKIPNVNPVGLPGSTDLPKAITFQADIRRPNLVPFQGRKSKAEMEKTAGYLVFLSKRGYKTNRPYYQFMLGQFLADLEQDAGTHQVLMDFLRKDIQPYNSDIISAPKTYNVLHQLALLNEMRILVRNQHLDELEQFLQIFEPRTGYEHLLLAEVYMLSGNSDMAKVHLDSACTNPNNHPENNWGPTFIPMRATVMVYSMGDPDLVKALGEGMHKRGRDAEKWPQWKSSWQIVDEVFALSEVSLPNVSNLKEGIFQGACVGFIDSIFVEITVQNGNLNRVQVVRGKEDRPYSALEVVPARIQSRQTLTVDCVTGATVTSCAVILSTAKAILKANGSLKE
ncbi:FMN-binding protein [candidate division KSB1 bacterium]|nr:FMN-binding protein [candidate division KSB1 bacterium]